MAGLVKVSGIRFPGEVAEDAQLRMELLRNPLLSEHEQRVCNVRSALLCLIRFSKRLLSQWINADKVAFLEGVAGGVGEALSCSVAQSFVEIANTIQGHFTTVDCATFMSLETLAQQHNDRPAFGTVVGVLVVVVQRQISQSQTVQNPFVRFSDRVVDVSATVQRCVQKIRKTVDVPQLQCIDRVVDVPAVLQRQVPNIQNDQKVVEVWMCRFCCNDRCLCLRKYRFPWWFHRCSARTRL